MITILVIHATAHRPPPSPITGVSATLHSAQRGGLYSNAYQVHEYFKVHRLRSQTRPPRHYHPAVPGLLGCKGGT